MKFLLLLFLSTVSVHAGFRCTLGNWACTAGCVVLGQTSGKLLVPYVLLQNTSEGLCDDDGKCWCSERSIALSDFRALLPSRCDLGQSVCDVITLILVFVLNWFDIMILRQLVIPLGDSMELVTGSVASVRTLSWPQTNFFCVLQPQHVEWIARWMSLTSSHDLTSII